MCAVCTIARSAKERMEQNGRSLSTWNQSIHHWLSHQEIHKYLLNIHILTTKYLNTKSYDTKHIWSIGCLCWSMFCPHAAQTHVCPDIVCFPATVLASADLFPLILSDENTKVLHTAVKMDNVKNLSGGTLGLENVFTKMCGSTQAADSSRLAISSYLDTFFNQNCISLRKKKRCRSPLELCWRLFPLFFNRCVFLGV